MKSAYELAMERLEKQAPSVKVTEQQKRLPIFVGGWVHRAEGLHRLLGVGVLAALELNLGDLPEASLFLLHSAVQSGGRVDRQRALVVAVVVKLGGVVEVDGDAGWHGREDWRRHGRRRR